MATNNPYLSEPEKKEENFGDKVIGTVDGISSVGKTANAVSATMGVAGSVSTHAAVNAIPFVGGTLSNAVGAKDLGILCLKYRKSLFPAHSSRRLFLLFQTAHADGLLLG